MKFYMLKNERNMDQHQDIGCDEFIAQTERTPDKSHRLLTHSRRFKRGHPICNEFKTINSSALRAFVPLHYNV